MLLFTAYNPSMCSPRRIFFAAVSALLAVALASAQTPAQSANRAGEVRLSLAPADIVRGAAPPFAAQRSEPIDWLDLRRTGRGGRIRAGLLDGSLLNVGSDSELRVLRHDPGARSEEHTSELQ